MYDQEKDKIIKHLKEYGESSYEEIHWNVLNVGYEKFKPIMNQMVEDGLIVNNGTTEKIKIKI